MAKDDSESISSTQTCKNILAVLADIFLALLDNFQKDPVVLKEYWWKVEEIKTDWTNTYWRARQLSSTDVIYYVEYSINSKTGFLECFF